VVRGTTCRDRTTRRAERRDPSTAPTVGPVAHRIDVARRCREGVVSDRTSAARVTKGYEELVAAAAAEVRSYTPREAVDRPGDDDVPFVDVRDAPEQRSEGGVPGAVHASRGMLEFHVDPASPYHVPDPVDGREPIFDCAAGGRSLLAARTVRETGLERVATREGGIRARREACGEVESVPPTMRRGSVPERMPGRLRPGRSSATSVRRSSDVVL
jgi:rhodanese-related sulfurtransferase